MAVATQENEELENSQDAGEGNSEEQEQQQAGAEEPGEVEATIPAPRPSRRRQREEEAQRLRSIETRLEEESRRNREYLERFERTIQERFQPQQQYQPQPQQQREERNYEREIFDLQNQMRAAYQGNDFDKLLDVQNKLYAAQAEKVANEKFQQIQRFIPQPQPQKAPWVMAVEAGYPDVLAHQMGHQLVVGSMHRLMAQGKNGNDPSVLREAFEDVRSVLGTRGIPQGRVQQDDEEGTVSAPIGGGSNGANRRAMMGSAPSQAVSGRKPSGGGDEVVTGLPANWRSIAKAGGVSEAAYLKRWKEGNPDKVKRK